MGMIRGVKVQMVVEDARRAYSEGRAVFIARFNAPSRLGNNSGSVGDWAEMLEAIEAEGWVLDRWAVGDGSKGLAAYPLFRRRPETIRGGGQREARPYSPPAGPDRGPRPDGRRGQNRPDW